MTAVSDVCARVAQAAIFEPLSEGGPCFYEVATRGSFYSEGEEVDPVVLIARAAKGDIAAQREISDMALHLALSGAENVDPFVTLSEGLMTARMAASQGQAPDEMRVVVMLSLASFWTTGESAADLTGEALARLELLADGDNAYSEPAAQLLAAYADREPAEHLERAKLYRARLVETE